MAIADTRGKPQINKIGNNKALKKAKPRVWMRAPDGSDELHYRQNANDLITVHGYAIVGKEGEYAPNGDYAVMSGPPKFKAAAKVVSAVEEDAETPAPAKTPESDEDEGETKAPNELDTLRAEFTALTGAKPHHLWGKKTLVEKIEEAKGEKPQAEGAAA